MHRRTGTQRDQEAAMAPRVITVSGPIPPERIGFTLSHEHTSPRPEVAARREQLYDFTSDLQVILDVLRDFRRRGGSCLIDVTSGGLGRDPLWLRDLATQSGIFIVMGTGWYRQDWYPPEARIDRRSVADLAAEIVAEFEHGVGDTKVRPGIIGEIGTDHGWVSAQEERVHRAAARAARDTGLAVTTHSLHSQVGLDQLRIFEDEGLDPARVIIGHADSVPSLDYYLAILDRGANVQFDLLGAGDAVLEGGEPRLIEIIVELLERGFADQVLLSHDVSANRQLKAYGGNGYTYLAQHFLPKLRTAAVGEGEIARMTIDNPRRLLTIP
jgi:predicted metal-dependent phosphotriesterase family hydrolase